MTPEQAKELLPVIQGFAEGKLIQSRGKGAATWKDNSYPEFDPDFEYRLKPEKRAAWVNVYDSGVMTPHTSRARADRVAFDSEKINGDRRTTCIRIEYEEGEGL